MPNQVKGFYTIHNYNTKRSNIKALEITMVRYSWSRINILLMTRKFAVALLKRKLVLFLEFLSL